MIGYVACINTCQAEISQGKWQDICIYMAWLECRVYITTDQYHSVYIEHTSDRITQ